MNIRNDANLRSLLGDFQRRGEPQFAWGKAVSSLMLLPALRGLWLMSGVDGSGGAVDFSPLQRNLTLSGSISYSHFLLAPYGELDGSSYLYATDHAAFDITGTETYISSSVRGLTLGGWFYLNSIATNMPLMSKYEYSSGNNRSYMLIFDTSDDRFKFRISSDGSSGGLVTVSSSVVVSPGQWYQVIGRFKPSTELAIFVNLTKNTNTSSIPASIYNSNSSFIIGAQDNGIGAKLNGRASMCFLCAAALADGICKGIYQQTRPMLGL